MLRILDFISAICKNLPSASLSLCFILAACGQAAAYTTPWQQHDHGRTRIAIAKQEQNDGKSYLVGVVQHELEPGWKTYWRYAGDAGLPLTVSTLSELPAMGEVELLWPAPKRILEAGLQSFVYDSSIAIPFRAEWKTPGETKPARMALSFMVCQNLCMPVNLSVPLDIKSNIASQTDKEATALLAAALKTVPQKASPRFTIKSARWVARDANEFLELDVASTLTLDKADVIVEGDSAYRFSPPGVILKNGGTTFRIVAERQIKHAPVPRQLKVTIIAADTDGEYAAGEYDVAPELAGASSKQQPSSTAQAKP
jgi:DsbC/DsbD-like thiol-disulfide interchange protein